MGLQNMETKKISFSKKGMGFIVGKKPTYFIIALFFLTIVFIVFGFTIQGMASSFAQHPDETEISVLLSRFLNSPDCFAYFDEETGRTYMGVIDLDKFNKENLVNCYPIDDYDFRSFRFSLESDDSNLKIKSNFIETKNFGSKRITTISQPIVIYNKGNFYRGNLLIDTQK